MFSWANLAGVARVMVLSSCWLSICRLDSIGLLHGMLGGTQNEIAKTTAHNGSTGQKTWNLVHPAAKLAPLMSDGTQPPAESRLD
jgi:hypothetical protein